MTTYYETANQVTISRHRAMIECKRHGASFADMVADMGDYETYDAQAVLRWLGY